ncbi:serine/threonine protein kinase DCLK3, putative [Entamoeba invadens IP1]|uniref:non-specific serine/threonine protein kinase n=1 Tax=Entamoeba invadens IP1 TaxID=370355 RepID=A0A0A1TVL4_ENTIV|nr:serine/threonine protein kinase DCLK3, putative [Entamoeba invadens IP1]ELP84472.1 serine/threonine protein kinase DCLK3, putative [Entamoeba invadens IP1]|eukprot:XP_004183818.1 serine/threonine protein kinase DCLK3, putative [Entamoeba invadens IP1]
MKSFKKTFSSATSAFKEKTSKLSKIVTEGINELKGKQAKMVMKKKEKKKQMELTKKKNLQKRLPPHFKEHKDFIEEEKKYLLFPKDDERRNRIVEDNYILGDELGRGAFAVVKKARKIPTGELCAIKVIDKRLVKPEETKLLLREIEITRAAQHVAIMKVFDVFESDINISIIMELLPGGTLFSRVSKNENGLPEVEARWILYQVVSALYYLHTHSIVHRDIKPENILLLGDAGLTCRVGDFGFAKNFSQEPLKTPCGTQDYAAPEILMGASEYSYQVDMWSVGVMLYVSLCGYLPFDGETLAENLEQMQSGEVVFDSDDWKHVSDNARDFIIRCLYPDPRLRMNAEQALSHPWFKGVSQITVTDGIVPVEAPVAVTKEEIEQQKKAGIIIEWEDGEAEGADDTGLPPAHVPPTREAPVYRTD